MKRVAVIALVREWNPAYSIVSVTQSQIRCLVRAGYAPRVLTFEGCPTWEYSERVDYRPCIPDRDCIVARPKLDAAFRARVARNAAVLEENLQGIQVAITHDVLLLRQFVLWNLALRRAARQLASARWLHWCHSAAFNEERDSRKAIQAAYAPMDRAVFVTPARSFRAGLADWFQTPPQKIKAVPNVRVTPEYMGFDARTCAVIQAGDLWACDILSIFPGQVSRASKQAVFCLYIMAALKAEGQDVRMVFANAYAGPSRAPSEQVAILILKWIAAKLGLTDTEVTFTSDIEGAFADGCPPEVIRDLFRLSNVFIHPSVSESGSLTLMEASAGSNLCVLNKNVPVFRDMAGDHALWVDCEHVVWAIQERYGVDDNGAAPEQFYRYFVDRRRFFRSTARRIVEQLQAEKSLMLATSIRQHRDETAVFNKYIKPLIEER